VAALFFFSLPFLFFDGVFRLSPAVLQCSIIRKSRFVQRSSRRRFSRAAPLPPPHAHALQLTAYLHLSAFNNRRSALATRAVHLVLPRMRASRRYFSTFPRASFSAHSSGRAPCQSRQLALRQQLAIACQPEDAQRTSNNKSLMCRIETFQSAHARETEITETTECTECTVSTESAHLSRGEKTLKGVHHATLDASVETRAQNAQKSQKRQNRQNAQFRLRVLT
jgi:hypothetical protein